MKLLLISIDDLSLATLKQANTPNLDRFTRLPRFWGAPNCSNQRAMLESGRYAPDPLNRVGGIFKRDDTVSLPTGNHLLGRQIQLLGKDTSKKAAHVGKWHLCADDDLHHRNVCGYEWAGGSQANLRRPLSNGDHGNYFHWASVVNGSRADVQEYATRWTTERADYRMLQGFDFVHASFNAVHKPYHTPPGMAESGPTAMLEYLDQQIGELLTTAVMANYGVIAITDNGGTSQDGGKGNLGAPALNCFAGYYNFFIINAKIAFDSTHLHKFILRVLSYPDITGAFEIPSDGIAFADLFPGVVVDPLPTEGRFAAVTDGNVKVIWDREKATFEYMNWEKDLPMDTGAAGDRLGQRLLEREEQWS